MTDEAQPAAVETPGLETPVAPEQETNTESAPADAPATESAETQTADESGDEATPDDESGEDTAEESPKKKGKGGFQKRIDKLSREKWEAELRAQRLENELALARKQQGEGLDAEPGPEPQIEQFTTVEDYKKAYGDWNKRHGYREARQEIENRRQQDTAVSIQATVRAREENAALKHPDYYNVINPLAPVMMQNPIMRQFVSESELGAEVAYELAKNPVVLSQIMNMTPFRAGAELLKMEERLKAPPPPKPSTKAPPPIKPVGSSEKAPVSLDTVDIKEFMRLRNEEEAKRRKG